jgi:PAS domain S-box-containing protein
MDESIKNEQAIDEFMDNSDKCKQAEIEDIISYQISNCIPLLRKISEGSVEIANPSLAIAIKEEAAELNKVLTQLNNQIAKRQNLEAGCHQKFSESQIISQSNNELYFRIDADANILDYQLQNPQIINKLTEVVIGENLLDYLPFSIKDRYQQAIIQVLTSKSLVKLEYFVIEENSNFEARLLPLVEQQIIIFLSHKKQVASENNNSIDFQKIVENSNNIIFALTIEGIFSYVSPNWTEILGHELEELIGKSFAPFMHPDDLPICVDYFQRVLTTGQKQDAIEYRIKHKNGSWQWHTSNSSAIKDANGNFLYFVGICHDTSEQQAALRERKHAQDELAQRSQLANFRADVDAALAQSQTLEYMMRRCTEALVEHINAAFARIWILNKQENVLELQASSGMYTHTDGPHRRVPVGQFKIGLIAQEGKPHLTNSVLTDPRVSNQEWAKREGMVAFAGYPLIIEGETVGVIAMFSCQIMTESVFNALEFAAQEIAIGIKRKQAEIALRESESRFRHLVETTNDGVWELDQKGVYTYVSQKIADILGYEPEEVLGKTPFDLMPPVEVNRVQKIFQVLTNSKQPLINFENKTLHKNGQLLVLETNGVPFFDTSGNYLGYRGVYQDITERKQAEEALQALVAGTAAVTGEEFFPVLVRHLANALGVCYVILAERITGDSGRARVLSFWAGDKLSETFVEYALANTPCEVVLQEGMRSYPCNVQQFFPQAKDLVVLEAESYLGTPLVDTFGIPIGHLCVLDTKPILQEERAKAILSIFAARATAELQRQCTETALRKSEAKFRAIAQREALLNRLASQIRASLELNYILETAVQEIRNLFQIDYCAFFWYRQNADVPYWECVYYEVEHSILPSLLTAQAIHPGFEIIAAKTLNREIIRIDDLKIDGELTMQQFLNDFGFTAFMSLPVHTQSGEIGALICGYCSGFRPWQETEVELLQPVTVQLAIAIDQAKLYTHSRLVAQTAQEKAQQLEKVLLELQQTQTQLIQTEKMSSLGQLVAGIAHEINNPVNFIYGNIKHTSEYVTDLLHLVEMFQEHYSPLSPEIETQIQEIDLDFLYQDLPKVLDSMKVGAERIRQIVLSLRNFSRLDEETTKRVDIHEGINSALLLLRSRLKSKPQRPEIKIIQEYGNLPQVLCNAGQMNQVFMNLLTNAIDALEEGLETKDCELEKEHSKSSILKICIRTQVQEDECIISIADNGSGMTDKVRNHIFDPFFTTKPVGKGIGMGLSISYQIVVKNHRGQLQCISVLGAGSEFIITIPIQ